MDSSFFIAAIQASGRDQTLLHETGDSAASVRCPSGFRATHHAFQSPASRTPSTWDESGRPKASRARSIAYIDEGGLRLRSAFFDHLPQRALDLRERRGARRPARVNHDIPLRPDFGAVQAERLTEPAFDAVADHRSADRARHGETQTRAASSWIRARQAKRSEQGT